MSDILNPTPSRKIDWFCEVCERPVEDKSGYITINNDEVRQYEEQEQEREEEIREARKTDPLAGVLSGSDIMDLPSAPHWAVLHERCDPDTQSNDYWIGIDRIRTEIQFLHWSAHLHGKGWHASTDWDQLIYKIIGHHQGL